MQVLEIIKLLRCVRHRYLRESQKVRYVQILFRMLINLFTSISYITLILNNLHLNFLLERMFIHYVDILKLVLFKILFSCYFYFNYYNILVSLVLTIS